MPIAATKVLQALLVARTLGAMPPTSNAWPVFVGIEPKTPLDCITINGTGALYQGMIQQTGERIAKPLAQIRVRGDTYNDGENKALAILDSLAAIKPNTPVQVTTTLGDTADVLSVIIENDPIYIGQQEGNAFIFTMDVMINYREV